MFNFTSTKIYEMTKCKQKDWKSCKIIYFLSQICEISNQNVTCVRFQSKILSHFYGYI